MKGKWKYKSEYSEYSESNKSKLAILPEMQDADAADDANAGQSRWTWIGLWVFQRTSRDGRTDFDFRHLSLSTLPETWIFRPRYELATQIKSTPRLEQAIWRCIGKTRRKRFCKIKETKKQRNKDVQCEDDYIKLADHWHRRMEQKQPHRPRALRSLRS